MKLRNQVFLSLSTTKIENQGLKDGERMSDNQKQFSLNAGLISHWDIIVDPLKLYPSEQHAILYY